MSTSRVEAFNDGVFAVAITLLGRYLNSTPNGSVAAAFYAVVMTPISISFQVLVAWALTHPHLLRPEVQVRNLRSVIPRFGLGLVTYAVSIALAFVSAPLVVAIYGITAVHYAFNQLPGWVTSSRVARRHRYRIEVPRRLVWGVSILMSDGC
jgi:uncharacterized membrane protein